MSSAPLSQGAPLIGNEVVVEGKIQRSRVFCAAAVEVAQEDFASGRSSSRSSERRNHHVSSEVQEIAVSLVVGVVQQRVCAFVSERRGADRSSIRHRDGGVRADENQALVVDGGNVLSVELPVTVGIFSQSRVLSERGRQRDGLRAMTTHSPVASVSARCRVTYASAASPPFEGGISATVTL